MEIGSKLVKAKDGNNLVEKATALYSPEFSGRTAYGI